MDEELTQALHSRFPPALRGTPYEGDGQHRADLLSFVSLCVIGAVACKAACAEGARAGEASGHPGFAMSVAEAEGYLADYPFAVAVPGKELTSLSAAVQGHIASRVEATRAAGTGLRAERLRELFGLSGFGFFALCCALSSALDRGFERLFAALDGDSERTHPTLGAVRACYELAHVAGGGEWAELLSPSAAWNRLLFAAPGRETPPLLRPVALRPGALGYLLGRPWQSRALAACGERPEPNPAIQPLFLEGPVRVARAALEGMKKRDVARLCILCGPPGSGKKLTLATAAEETGAEFFLIRLDELPETPPEELVDEVTAAALLWGTVPCFQTEVAAHCPQLARFLAVLRPYRLGVFLLTARLRGNLAPEGALVSRVDYATPSLAQAVELWRIFAAGYPTAPDVDPARLAAKYRLTPGRIEAALRAAAEAAKADGEQLDAARVDAAVLLGNTGRLSEISDYIPVTSGWDDLVLSEAPKTMLRDVCNRFKYRHLVETAWGFGGKSAYGRGLSILLYGPPGTGKTMSAQVIAGELGLPLYRINLAQIISKYIGETAKNLDAVFTEAKNNNVVLFFDEADALFSKRTEVKSSNDRHANSESSYLLQKIEEYSGVSILATNLANNFDEAFRRRIGYMIHIHMPSPEERLALWRGALPAAAPLAPGVDLPLLAQHLEFSGSVIKAAALQAAYFAADEGALIGMEHLAKAVRRELQKLGKSEPHFLTTVASASGEVNLGV